MNLDAVQIYIHIPFCVRKCSYCDFLSFPCELSEQRRYVEALLREIRSFGEISSNHEAMERPPAVRSIFFGGGTPSVLPAEWITEILEEIRKHFEVEEGAEITIEANPGTVDIEKLSAYRIHGINRISFGCQSFHEEELRLLGRIHTPEEIREGVHLAREAGFTNLNLDLISAVPGQTLADWKENLRQAIALAPEHISAYSLILEEDTPLYRRIYGEQETEECSTIRNNEATEHRSSARDKEATEHRSSARDKEASECLPPPSDKGTDGRSALLPDEDTERAMADKTKEILEEAGYVQYEISNYAKPGYACRHNTGYWTGIPYIGFGLGAASYLPASWIRNRADGEDALMVRLSRTRDMAQYLTDSADAEEVQYLGSHDLQAEFLILGLRMTEGIEDAEFARRFGHPLEEVYGDTLQKHVASGFLCREDGRTFFSARGMAVSNAILVDFLP